MENTNYKDKTNRIKYVDLFIKELNDEKNKSSNMR